MDVHLIDGTYELFRYFHAVPASQDSKGREIGAVRGVLRSVLSMIEHGTTHLGVATDHVVESFRNDLYSGYKTSEGVPESLLSQFPLLEEALDSMGVMVWPWGAHLPTTGPALFFLLATAWFVTMIVVSARTMAQRAVCGYHALMMLAMVWMYADTKHHHVPDHSDMHHHMGMGATGMPASRESHEWVSALNWFWFVGFVVAAIFWAYRSTGERRHGAADDWHGPLGSGAQAMAAAGMAITFGAILFQHQW